nr:hypothetical protein [Tanacetum cinerariifolium]
MDPNIDFSSSNQIQTLQYPKIHPPSQEISDEVFQANHSIQYKEYSENSSNEIAVSNYNQEKEGPPQDSDIHHLIREECGIEVCEEQKQKIEDTILELVKICRQKELLCIHDNEVKNVVEQSAERENHIIKSLQNFRVIQIADTIIESLPSLPIPIQDNNSQREEIDIVTETDDVLPPSVENDDDSEEDIHFLEELLSDNSIPLTKDESSDFDHQDDPSIPLPPPEPPDAEYDFETDVGKEISVVMNTIDELKCLDPKDEFEDNDYFLFMFVIRIFLPILIYSKMFLSFLSAESEDTIFDPGISVESRWYLIGTELLCAFLFI